MNINKTDKPDAYPAAQAPAAAPPRSRVSHPTPAAESVETASPHNADAASVLADRLKVTSYERGNAMLRLPFQMLLAPQDVFSSPGHSEEEQSFALGRAMGRATDSPQEALRLARQLPYLWDAQDMAIIQHPTGEYQVFELENAAGVLDNDLDNYQQLRDISASQIHGEPNVVAIMGDNKSLRFLQPQAGPAYARPADAPPMLPASGPAPTGV